MRVLDDLCEHWQVNLTDPCAMENDELRLFKRKLWFVLVFCAGMAIAATAMACS